MKSAFFTTVASATMLSAVTFGSALATETTPETIIVTGTRPSAAEAAQLEARTRPGNVSVVRAEQFADRYALSFRDTLQLTPGVIAQPRFAEEVRLSIRGSGVANNAHLRGVELLFDGVPLNGADGFGDFQELDPTFASAITVWRGANAFASGAASLGGAIEMIGLSGRDASHAATARIDTGSFGTRRLGARLAHAGNRGDISLSGTWNRVDGFRENGEQNSMRAYLQTGWRWSERLETRAGLLWNEVNARIPGQLTIEAALANPRQAAASNRTFAFARDIDSLHGWMTTTADLGQWGELRVSGAATDRALYHPLTSVIDQDTEDFVLSGDWRGDVESPAGGLAWTLGARWRDARTDAKSFAGTPDGRALRGRLTANSIQRAGGVSIYGEVRLSPRPDLTVLAGFNQTDTDRDVENLLNPAASDGRSFSGFSPKLGVLWEPLDGLQVFANASGLYEPPSFGQLTQGGFVTFVPIKAQEGRSLEAGVRRSIAGFAVELTAYDAALDNEFIAFQVSPLIPAAIFNAGKTIHRGLEAGVRGTVAEDIAGGRLSLASAWTLNDFRFDGDPVYGDNDLAGVPASTLVAELAWDNGRVRIAPSAFIQSGTWVDFANSLKAPGYTTWNLTASWRVNDTLTVSVDGRNLTDERLISMVGTIANARATGANLAIATPGEGRAVFASARISLGARR